MIECLPILILKAINHQTLKKWKNITSKVLNSRKDVNIGIIGKYVDLKDAYKSLDEALIHGGISNNVKVNLKRMNSENLNQKILNLY